MVTYCLQPKLKNNLQEFEYDNFFKSKNSNSISLNSYFRTNIDKISKLYSEFNYSQLLDMQAEHYDQKHYFNEFNNCLKNIWENYSNIIITISIGALVGYFAYDCYGKTAISDYSKIDPKTGFYTATATIMSQEQLVSVISAESTIDYLYNIMAEPLQTQHTPSSEFAYADSYSIVTEVIGEVN